MVGLSPFHDAGKGAGLLKAAIIALSPADFPPGGPAIY
jgi:hypothetical protein